MRVHFLAETYFVRPTDDHAARGDGTTQPTSRIRDYFHTLPVHVNATHEPQLLDFSAIISELNNTVDQFTCRGSGYVLTCVTKLTVIMVPFNPLGVGGSSYILTPRQIANKHAVVNLKNPRDDVFQVGHIECVVSRNSPPRSPFEIHSPQKCHRLQLSPISRRSETVFSLRMLHCLAHDEENKCFLLPHMHLRSNRISLLLLDAPDGRDLHHYVWVKNLSCLVTNHHRHARHLCMSCLQAFTLRRMLEQHEPNCLAHAPQRCIYPSRGKAMMSFNMHHYEFPFHFYLVANFECFLRPPTASDGEPNLDAFRVPSGFCVFRIMNHESYRTDLVVHSGDDVMRKFFSHIFAKAKTISRDMTMVTLSTSEEAEFVSTTNCGNCKRSFSDENPKMRHHNHVTGKYLFLACSNCNLALKPRKCRIATAQNNLMKVVSCSDDDDDNDDNDGDNYDGDDGDDRRGGGGSDVATSTASGLTSCRSCFTICHCMMDTSCCSSFARSTPHIRRGRGRRHTLTWVSFRLMASVTCC